MSPSHMRQRSPDRNGLWSAYLPLVLTALFVTAMVAFVPTDPHSDLTAGRDTDATVPTGETASGWAERVGPCDDRALQVEGDGYSPPCFAFSGDNGGATSRGVTSDRITISYRMTTDPHILAVLAQVGGVGLDVSNEELVRTAEALVDYFNLHFQFYGRRLELERVTGRGNVLLELMGGGQEEATNDAVSVATQTQAFADVTGLTQPYADALARNQVVNVGAPYMSREWFVARRPYAWSNFPDCSIAAEAASEYQVQRLLGEPAHFAGGDLAARTRTLGVITPTNMEYRQCADAGIRTLNEAGHRVEVRQEYVLDVAQLQTQAASLLGRLKAENVTSVVCGCDPLLLFYLVQHAAQQNYQPEWLVIGVGFIDLDLVGQMISKTSPDQWTRAFGSSPSGQQAAPGTGEGYTAFKSVRPNDEPSQLVEVIYQQLYQLAIGIQMAGPDLTPHTFETGMFSYPGGNGTAGHWDFGPAHYTGITDIREIWWDPNTTSPFNGQPGTYRDNGQRWNRGDIPPGTPDIFN